MDPELPNRETLELANELLRERLEAQKSGIDRIEAKALALLGFAAIAFYAFAFDANSRHARFKRRSWLTCVGALTAAIALSAKAIGRA